MTNGPPPADNSPLSALHRRVIDAIESWDPTGHSHRWPRARFDALAAELFAHQYTHIEAYRTLCDGRGVTPGGDPSPDEIPAVPTDAFKFTDLFAGAEPAHVFRTSGTTADEARGEHHFRTRDVYRASLHPTFKRFCNPGGDRLRMLILAPSPEHLPDSSLSFMLGALVQRHGDAESDYFVTLDDDGRWEFATDALCRALDKACDDQATTMLLGTAFGFAEFLERQDRRWQLPEDSRLMETGGFKGRFRDLSRAELYAQFADRFGLPRSRCLSEYSMTELSSQTYTDHLVSAEATGRFYGPPWLDIKVADPVSLEAIDEVETPGLIRFFDLANVDSVCAIQTSDRGIIHADGGLQFLGRAPDAQLRGCSLTIEELVGTRK